jgi:hypothetical protein
MGRDRPIPCPPCCPDVTQLVFFFSSYIKDQVLHPKVGSAVELRARIKNVIASVTLEMLETIGREIEYRFDIP